MNRCTIHPAYDADYCPRCGTAAAIATDHLSLCRSFASGLPLEVLTATRTHVTVTLDSDPSVPQVWTAEDFIAYVEDPDGFLSESGFASVLLLMSVTMVLAMVLPLLVSAVRGLSVSAGAL